MRDLTILADPNAPCGDKQNALARILGFCLTAGQMSPGEVRKAIRLAGDMVGHQDVLNYEHPLLPDPVVSCASKQQLLDNLRMRFSAGE